MGWRRSIRMTLGAILCWSLVANWGQTADDVKPQPAASTPADAASLGAALAQVAQRSVASTVGIYCEKDEYASYFGTGTVITADGHILTSTTVVPAGAEKIEVFFSDFVKREAKIIETSEPLETALIKVEAQDLPYLPLATELPAVGTRAFTTSNANNVLRINGRASFSKGHVSGIYEVKNLGGESLYAGLAIETTAAVNPGADGGPILNDRGQLCGVISLNVSAARWQGVGVPTKEILARLETFKSEKVKPPVEPLLAAPIAEPATQTIAKGAADWSQWVVGIRVERKYPAEFLPRTPWETFLPSVPDWGAKKRDERGRILGAYFEVARLLEVNQMLRRPADPVTGVVVSPEGHILTSVFNLADDIVFLSKKSGEPHRIEFKGTVAEVLKEPENGWNPVPNPITKISVLLADGSSRDAQLVARHMPLGVALLKVEGSPLPAINVADTVAKPVLGEAVGMLGFAGGAGTRYTLNEGIVSAPSRNRGMHFQTDAMLNYGNSGGPVISTSGKLLGISTTPIEPRTVQGRLFKDQELNGWQIAPNSGVGMVAWSERIRDTLEDLKAGKSTTVLPGPFLGVSPDQLRAFGTEVILGQVGRDTPAEKAGLRRGDRILEVDGEEVSEWKDLTAHLEQHKPGDTVKLKIRRAGIAKHLVVKGKKVSNEAELQDLLKSLDKSDKLEAEVVVEDVKVVEAVLGERR